MSASDRTKPPAEWLHQLSEAGHWDRLIQIATESLAIDPNDPETHREIAWALAKTNRLPELLHHVTFLLSVDPDDARHHHLAAIYYIESKLLKQAAPHVDAVLRLEPQSATYHYLAGVHALRSDKMDKARTHLRNARELAPGWAPAAHLEIKLDGVHQKAASDAWDRIRRLEEALSLDPQNAAMLTSIGEIHLLELERPHEAEDFFRRALCIDPTDHDRQALLLKSLRARSLLYRTLSLPAAVGSHVLNAIREGRINVLFLIIAVKVVAAFFVWLVTVGAFFAPAAKVYEWFVLAEIPRSRPFPRLFAWMDIVRGWPVALRMSLCAVTIVGFWGSLLAFCGVAWSTSLQIMGWIFGVHFALVAILVGVRHLRARFGLWRHHRRRRHENTGEFEMEAASD